MKALILYGLGADPNRGSCNKGWPLELEVSLPETNKDIYSSNLKYSLKSVRMPLVESNTVNLNHKNSAKRN